MANPTLDEDLDQILRSGAGRRFLTHFLKPIQGPIPLQDTPEKTAYELGRVNVLRELDVWLKEVNLQCWFLMHHEAVQQDDTDDLNKRDD